MAFHIIHALHNDCFKDERIPLFLKSIKIQAPLLTSPKSYISNGTLNAIIDQCDFLFHPETFKSLYLLCFFSLLRLLNIPPHTIKIYDSTRQLARGNFICVEHGAVVFIKWTKTMQDRKQAVTIPLPNLGDSHLCPIKAVTIMIQLFPASPNDPLFVIPRISNIVPLTDSVAREHFKKISISLVMPTPFTFHTFRRACAIGSFQQGVPLEHILKHGTWKSDSVWSYLSSTPSSASSVSLAFQQALRF